MGAEREPWFSDPGFLGEVEDRVDEIRALDAEEGKADNTDDRVGIRYRRRDLERSLGRRIVERVISDEISRAEVSQSVPE